MYCSKCGIMVEGKFCPECGTPAGNSERGAGGNEKITQMKLECEQKVIPFMHFLIIFAGVFCALSPFFRVLPESLEDRFCNMFTSWIIDDIPSMMGKAVWVIILTVATMIFISVKNNYAKIFGLVFCIASRAVQASCVGTVSNCVFRWMYEESYGSYRGPVKLGVSCGIMKASGIIMMIAVAVYCVIVIGFEIYETVNMDTVQKRSQYTRPAWINDEAETRTETIKYMRQCRSCGFIFQLGRKYCPSCYCKECDIVKKVIK